MADSQMAVRGQASLALRAKNVHKIFNGIEVLHGVDLEVPAGARHAVVGENGAGKSTLMKIICGILEPEAGEIEVFGEALPRVAGHAAGRPGPRSPGAQPRPYPVDCRKLRAGSPACPKWHRKLVCRS